MDFQFFRRLLDTDSTSGKEREFALALASELPELFAKDGARPQLDVMEVGDGSLNLLFSWGRPELVFCTHLDTVPPYIAPRFLNGDGVDLPRGRENEAVKVCGRGSNDAKGQAFAMIEACRRLAAAGRSGFGLLLVSGEETGSFGAKAFAAGPFRAPYLIVGEPTDNAMVSASKGTKAYSVHIGGRRCHSGYPEQGVSAVETFRRFLDALDASAFPEDALLGRTVWNVGRLVSDNPQNILSDSLDFRLYFRTTFASDAAVCRRMEELGEMDFVEVEALGGDVPREYMTLEGFPSAPVSFGSDAPHLDNFGKRAIFGPGSILSAHTDGEYVMVEDLRYATEAYVAMYEKIIDGHI